jgi:CubicO group peptidase (beta-lactamase class C family)
MNDLEEVVAGYYPNLDVGERWEYNGTGVSLGARIIELMSNELLAKFYRNHLLDPLGCANTDVMGTYGDAFSVPLDMAKIGQMLLNKGAYGDMRFFSEETCEKMMPRKLPDLPGSMAGLEYGVGTSRYDETVALGLGDDSFGHGAASSAIFLVDPTNKLIIVMTRNTAGKEFDKYKEPFITAVLDSVAE